MREYDKTCSIFNLKDNAVTFVRKEEYLELLLETDKHVKVIMPQEFLSTAFETVSRLKENIYIKLVDRVDVDHTFFQIHNELYKDFVPPQATIGKNCKIHDSVVLDVDGLKLANSPDGRRIQFKHTGNVIIEDDVEIGPLCVIHRGTMDSTIIKKGVKMASKINIGHNAYIGENTAIASGAIIAGSKFGKNCWIGMAAVINQGLNICDNVVIGAGSLVTKDIDKSGIYVGSPVKFLKPIEKGWNF